MQNKGVYSASFKGGKYLVKVRLQIYSWEEDGIRFAYSPAMDLSGYGKTRKEAEQSFHTSMQETLKYMDKKETIFDELERLGWLVNRKKKRVQAPEIESLLKENKDFKSIHERPGVRVSNKFVELELA